MNEYPKWLQRSPDLGPVLVTSAKEEQSVVAAAEAEELAKAEASTAEAQEDASQAEDAAKITLSTQQSRRK